MVTIHLLLRWPSILVVFAGVNWALPWARVGFLVFGQITGTLEFFVTAWLTASLGCKLSGRGRALAAGHGTHNGLVVLSFFAEGALEPDGILGVFVHFDGETGGDGDEFTVLLHPDKFGWTSVLGQSSVESDFVGSVSLLALCS